MEDLKIRLKTPLPNMQIKYQVHVQNKGWMDLKSGGEIAGTIGESLRIEAIKIDVAKYRYAYKYDAAGNLAYLQDVVNGVSYKYIYDLANRLVAVEDSKGNGLSYGYDANNQRSSYSEKIQGSTYGTNYSYDKDGKPKTISYYRNNPINITFNYDAIGRMDNKIINTGLKQYNTSYKYTEGVNGQTTTKVKSISNGIDGGTANTIAYTYDDNGNIKSITENGKIIIYDYNSLNELKREDNQVLNKTIVYDYDNGGNIKTKTEYEPCIIGEIGSAVPKKVYNYTYEDTIWKDQLSTYEGQEITYDAIGNPVSYNGYTYAWEAGRQLKSISKNGQTIGYKYNDAGIRTEKTVNEITTKYKLVGDKVTFESNGTDYMYYTYDSEDNLVSVTMNEVEYYYIRNAQGDIIGLIDSTGTQVVSYSYDSWGKLLSITGTLKDTVGVKNPYRYRGYRYDSETQLYYLQSRYYNPEWGRFINADDVEVTEILKGELLSANLFAYCMNDPINETDSTGFFIDTIFDIISIGVSISKVMANPTMAGNWVALGADIICAAIPGATGGGMAVSASSKVTSKAVRIINQKYASTTFKLSRNLAKKYSKGVKFSSKGFPIFTPYAKARVKIKGLRGNTTTDFTAANKAAGFKSTPKGYTWHHVEDGLTMELVPTDLHQAVRHTGGVALIKNGLVP